MKKYVAFLIAVMMILAMTACSKAVEPSESSTELQGVTAEESTAVEESSQVEESSSMKPIEFSSVKPSESSKPEESTKPTESNKSSESNKSAHTHNWQPVYRTVHHDAEYEQVQVPGEFIQYELACGCGYDCGFVRYAYEMIPTPQDNGTMWVETLHILEDQSMYAFDELEAHRAEEFSKAHANITYTKTLFTSAEGTEIWLYKCPVCDELLMKEYKETGDTIYGDDPEEEWRKHTAVNEVNVFGFICTTAGIKHNNYYSPGSRIAIRANDFEEQLVREAYDEQVIDHYVCSCGQTR